MTLHIGTKLVKLTPMSHAEYNEYRGWQLPDNENGLDDGYLVEYLDGGTPNDPRHQGYISWSPKPQADNAYRPVTGMTFGLAIEALRKGHKVARKGWNGKNQFVVYIPGTPDCQLKPGTPYHSALNTEETGHGRADIAPHLDLFNAQGVFQPGWAPSQSDVLAEDWEIV